MNDRIDDPQTALAPATTAMPTDILAYNPDELKGNFHRAARASQIAALVLENLPKWTGSHARVPGNFPLAEITRFGTLQLTNEVTMPDLQGFLTWICGHAGMNVSAIQKCGHPESARVARPRDGVGVGGLTAEEATSAELHCSMCEANLADRTEIENLRLCLAASHGDVAALRDRNKNQAQQLQQMQRELDAACEALASKLAARKKTRPAKAGNAKAKATASREGAKKAKPRRKAKA